MNKANYLSNPTSAQNGMYPVTIEGLEFIQSQINAVQNLAFCGGESYVIKEPTADPVRVGLIVWNGEILPLTGTPANYIQIKTTKEDINSEKGVYEGVREIRVAKYVAKPVATAETDTLKKRASFPDIATNIELERMLRAQAPIGVIQHTTPQAGNIFGDNYLPCDGREVLKADYPLLKGAEVPKTWTCQDVGGGQTFMDIAFGNGKFVAAALNKGIATSTDGVSWAAQTGFAENCLGVAYGAGIFVLGCSSGTIYISPDGNVWNKVATGLAGAAGLRSVIYANNTFVVGGANNGGVITSTDGINWTPVASTSLATLMGLASDGKTYVAVGNTNNAGEIMTSTDCITWEKRGGEAIYRPFFGVAYGNNQFIALTSDGAVMTSPDGISWTSCGLPTGLLTIGGVAVENGVFIAYGSQGFMATSTDGVIWTIGGVALDDGSPVYGVSYGGGCFVAVGGGGRIATSFPDSLVLPDIQGAYIKVRE